MTTKLESGVQIKPTRVLCEGFFVLHVFTVIDQGHFLMLETVAVVRHTYFVDSINGNAAILLFVHAPSM